MWPNPYGTADLVTFTEEILDENFFFNSDIITGAKKKTITAKILVTSQNIIRNISH